uniref:Uncharacterized protein n=1 Tax=Rhizochromulina marina TaxID=1034831 RepID=A0A7S2WWK1_9STRA
MAATVFTHSPPVNPFGKRSSAVFDEAAHFASETAKRRRLCELSNHDAHPRPAEDRSLARAAKRCRMEAVVDENGDMPIYSQRQMDEVQQSKLAELAQMQHQCGAALAGKDEILQQAQAELEELRARLTEQERLTHENKLLKRAVAIQHNAGEKMREMEEKHRQEIKVFLDAGVQASEYIRRLEQTNFTLKAHLQQMTAPHVGGFASPHWGT